MRNILFQFVPIALLGGVIACGGPPRTAPAASPPASPCTSMANHLGAMAHADEAMRPLIVQVTRESCEGDAWSTEAIDCMSRSSFDLSGLVPAQTLEERFGGCGRHLSAAQHEGMGARIGAELDRRMNPDGTPPEPEPEADEIEVPPPPPPPRPPPRSR